MNTYKHIYIHTYIHTYSMVQSPSSAANWFAASQKILRISRNPKVHYRTHKRPPNVSILGQSYKHTYTYINTYYIYKHIHNNYICKNKGKYIQIYYTHIHKYIFTFTYTQSMLTYIHIFIHTT